VVARQPWTGAQRAFAVKAFYKYGDRFVIAQREFRRECGIHRNLAVPSAHAIKTWVQNFDATDSTLKKRGGCVKSVEHWLQTARVTQSSDAQNGVDPFNGVSHYRNVLGCTYYFDMYMSYRWRESFNTVRFVTSSQRGLTCVGAECRKEGGGDGPYIRRGAD